MTCKPATYLFYVRLVQLFISITVIGENGWLISLIARGRLGLTSRMLAIEAISAAIMAYTGLEIILLHCLQKSTKRRYLIAFFACDVFMIGLFIANLTIFGIAGVPANCSGMTRENYNSNDAANNPAPGFTTIRFGPGTYGNSGQLDIYCDIPKSCYFLCVLGMYATFFHLAGCSRALLDPQSSLAKVQIISSKQTCLDNLEQERSDMKEIESGPNKAPSLSDTSEAESNITPMPLHSTTDMQPACHELATATPELESKSQRLELCSPVSPMEMEFEASIVNGSRGSTRSNPPAYMPSFDRTMSTRSWATGSGGEKS